MLLLTAVNNHVPTVYIQQVAVYPKLFSLHHICTGYVRGSGASTKSRFNAALSSATQIFDCDYPISLSHVFMSSASAGKLKAAQIPYLDY